MRSTSAANHAAYTEDGTQFVDLPGDTIVSMNLWGFTQPMVSELWSRLSTFLAQQVPQNPMKCEFYLPNAVNQQLEDGTARVRVLPCEEVWHGVTYREDLASVKEAICALKAAASTKNASGRTDPVRTQNRSKEAVPDTCGTASLCCYTQIFMAAS